MLAAFAKARWRRSVDREDYRLSPFIPSYPSGRTTILNDCTLREGEQSSDAAFSDDDRRRIAEALADAGVGRLQLSHRADLAANRTVIEAARSMDTEVLILAFQENWRNQVDRAIESGASHLNIINRVSPPLLRLAGLSVDDVLAASLSAISYGVERGAAVIYSAGDTMRADWGALELLYPSAVEAGASAVYVLDTSGVATPSAISDVVRRVVELVGVPVGIHAHNDLGLGLANALAGFEAGAALIDTCVNGMGDRSGNPATDEVALALKLVYGSETSVRLTSMSALSELVASASGAAIPPNKPLVGRNAYTHKLDIHVKAVQADALAFQPIRPELVGAKTTVVIGRSSGPITLAVKLAELGIPALDEEQAQQALELADSYAERNKRSVPDEELARIVEEVRR
jgi:isopropylmalate/homocitrate/citramalate synthase